MQCSSRDSHARTKDILRDSRGHENPWIICKSCNLVARVFGFEPSTSISRQRRPSVHFPSPPPTSAPTTKQAPQGMLAGVQNVSHPPSSIRPHSVKHGSDGHASADDDAAGHANARSSRLCRGPAASALVRFVLVCLCLFAGSC